MIRELIVCSAYFIFSCITIPITMITTSDGIPIGRMISHIHNNTTIGKFHQRTGGCFGFTIHIELTPIDGCDT